MAEQVTINKPAPYLEAAGQTYLELLTKLTGQAPTADQIAAMNPMIANSVIKIFQ